MSKQFCKSPSLGALRVAEVARSADVTPATVRYYARMKLLTPRRNPDNGYRCFSQGDLRRVEFIRQAQSLGLTIADIKTILATVDDGESPCQQVKSLVTDRLLHIQQQIADLHATEARIIDAIAGWRDTGSPAPQDGEYCPLIERVDVTSCRETPTPRRQTRRKPLHEACRCPPQVDDRVGLSLA